ncbi:MAG: hypothetical protein JWN13_2475 [Betaproteobacteria bacterium]|nr:hypothetical protein [Betaproteobacteria bacterium]
MRLLRNRWRKYRRNAISSHRTFQQKALLLKAPLQQALP